MSTNKRLKYIAGGIGGIFLHQNHFNNPNLKRLEGWWGHRLETRFKMNNGNLNFIDFDFFHFN